ncbi:MAG: hypothetical protein MUO81_07845 [Thermoplasmata archaeon]|nr:hypothetical protein [Thermoplasmata archaeon]
MTLEKLKVDGCTIHILSVIKGLKSETEKVRKAFEETKPDVVAISLSREEVEGLKNIPDDYEPELSRYDEIYAEGLGRFGEVAAPPPCYVATLELAQHEGIPLIPVDMDEQSYTDLYCAVVPGTALFRHSTRIWLLKRRTFSDDSPEKFVLAWDKAVNNMEGFRLIERKRAQAMAKGIKKACAGSKDLLAVIEFERATDVLDILREEA